MFRSTLDRETAFMRKTSREIKNNYKARRTPADERRAGGGDARVNDGFATRVVERIAYLRAYNDRDKLW